MNVMDQCFKEYGYTRWVAADPHQSRPFLLNRPEQIPFLNRSSLLVVLPESLQTLWERIEPLFVNIMLSLGRTSRDYCAVFLSPVALSHFSAVLKRVEAQKVLSFGASLPEEMSACVTLDLPAVWQDPLLKKQVWADVYSLRI